jgi:hypothetical protein
LIYQSLSRIFARHFVAVDQLSREKVPTQNQQLLEKVTFGHDEEGGASEDDDGGNGASKRPSSGVRGLLG